MERNRRVVLESEDNLVIIHYQVVGYSVDKRTWGMAGAPRRMLIRSHCSPC